MLRSCFSKGGLKCCSRAVGRHNMLFCLLYRCALQGPKGGAKFSAVKLAVFTCKRKSKIWSTVQIRVTFIYFYQSFILLMQFLWENWEHVQPQLEKNPSTAYIHKKKTYTFHVLVKTLWKVSMPFPKAWTWAGNGSHFQVNFYCYSMLLNHRHLFRRKCSVGFLSISIFSSVLGTCLISWTGCVQVQ